MTNSVACKIIQASDMQDLLGKKRHCTNGQEVVNEASNRESVADCDTKCLDLVEAFKSSEVQRTECG
jgi:hypothetical protein